MVELARTYLCLVDLVCAWLLAVLGYSYLFLVDVGHTWFYLVDLGFTRLILAVLG